MKILVSIPAGKIRDTFLPQDVAEKLESLGSVSWNDNAGDYSAIELRDRLAGVDVCVTGWGNACFDANVLSGADNLKLVAHTGGSVAPYVSEAFFDRGVTIVSGNRMYAESVAEGVMAYILCALRRLPYYSGEIQSGRWSSPDSWYEGLLDQTVGLVGFGMVARHLVKMLEPFRANVMVYDPFISDDVLAGFSTRRATLEEIMSGSKVISLHAPRTPGTHHMITAEHLRLVRDGALLVNTARGSLVDEEALADELKTGRFNAVLDVFETEPLPMGSRLRGLQNVFLVPHMAGPTKDRRKLVTLALMEEIDRFFAGMALRHKIDREYAMSMTK